MTWNLDNVPPRPGPKLPIVRVETTENQLFLCFSEEMFGVWTHWRNGRSEACHANVEECNGCQEGFPKRWKGYLHVHDFQHERHCFLELTPAGAQLLLAQVPSGKSLRGFRLQLRRTKGGKQGRLKVVLLEPIQSSVELPMALTPLEVLDFLWKSKRKAS